MAINSATEKAQPVGRSVPTLDPTLLRIRKQVGEGSFASVYAVKLLRAKNKDGASSQEQGRELVLKRVRDDVFDESFRSEAAKCLEREASVLSSLPSHPNVISLVYVSENFWEESYHGYLILERMDKVLSKYLEVWRDDQKQDKPLAAVGQPPRTTMTPTHMTRTVDIGLGIARALDFFHSHHVMYRDLKPDNVGFDVEGNVRIFDFGLARMVIDRDDLSVDERRFTRMVGTPKYMAPEVLSRSGFYDYSVDIYSFAILLWEVATLREPFEKYKSFDSLREHVMKRHGRPAEQFVASPKMKKLLKMCWDHDPQQRPKMSSIQTQLEGMYVETN